jgi:hypothetical protein
MDYRKKANSRIFYLLHAVISILLIGLITFGCENEPDDFGLSIQPGSDKPLVYNIDSLQVSGFTLKQDSILTDEPAYSLIGSYQDPVFGTTTAEFVSQFTLSLFPFAFEENDMIDSAVLSMRVAGVFGDPNSTYKLMIRELKTEIADDTAYYSNTDAYALTEGSEPIALGSFTASDTIITINLFNGLPTRLIADTNAFKDPNSFKEALKGLYLFSELVSGDGALMALNMLDFYSRLTIYYYNSSTDSMFYDLIVASTTARFNVFNHDFETANPLYKINQFGTQTQDSVVYVQSLGGTEAKIVFPDLDEWIGTGTKAINKAELILPIELDDPAFEGFDPPDKLTLFMKNENDEYLTFIDRTLGGTYFGGDFDLEKYQYKFNISRVLNDYLLGEIDEFVFYVAVDNMRYNFGRIVLSSGLNSRKIQLKITYTDIGP